LGEERMVDSRGYEMSESDVLYIKYKYNNVYVDKLYHAVAVVDIKTALFTLKIFDLDAKMQNVLHAASRKRHSLYSDCAEEYRKWSYISYSNLYYVALLEGDRTHQMPELFCRSVKAGDLVLYILNNTLKYGLVISDISVINELGSKVQPSVVILLDNLTENEISISQNLKNLSLKYMIGKSLNKDKSKNIGSLYKKGNFYFINLGHRVITGHPLNKNSNYSLDIENSEKVLWVGIESDYVKSEDRLRNGDLKYLLSLISKSCADGILEFKSNAEISGNHNINGFVNVFDGKFSGYSKYINTFLLPDKINVKIGDFRVIFEASK
jgi:hypothetical protein